MMSREFVVKRSNCRNPTVELSGLTELIYDWLRKVPSSPVLALSLSRNPNFQ